MGRRLPCPHSREAWWFSASSREASPVSLWLMRPNKCRSHVSCKTFSSEPRICCVCHHRPCGLSPFPTMASSLSRLLEIALSCFWIQPGMLNSLSFKAFVCIQNGMEDSHVSSVYRLHWKPFSSNKRQSWVSNLGILNLKPGVSFLF